MEKEKRKKFNIFDSQRVGKGVEKGEVKSPTLKNFFKYFGRSFSKLLNINLMFTLYCIPVFFALFAVGGYFDNIVQDAAHPLSATVTGLIINGEVSPYTMSMYGVYGIKSGIATQISVGSIVFYCLAALVIFTWGYANAGMAYTLRNLQKGEPVFVWSDFFRTLKKNKVQAMIVGIIDIILIGLFFYNLQFYSLNSANTVFYFLYIATFILIAVYSVMRMYLYTMLVTFKIGTFKLFKNAFIFCFAALKRNVMGLIGVILAIGLNAFIFFVFMPLGAVLPFVMTFAVCGYIGMYTAYPKIKEVMIDPYYDENGNEKKNS